MFNVDRRSCNKMRPLVLFIFFVVLVVNSVVVAYSNEFTITIEPGKEDCFYTPVAKNIYLEVDYQVRYTYRFPLLNNLLMTFLFF